MSVALLLEATGNDVSRRIDRSGRAYSAVLNDRNRAERDQVRQLLSRLQQLKRSLTARLLGEVTDFKRFTLQTLLADVDREIDEVTKQIELSARATYNSVAQMGTEGADQSIQAAQLKIDRALPGVDSDLVTTAFENTVDLLSQPMKQFGSDVKIALRQVSLAGDNKFEAIQRLRDKIAGQGFDNAQYKAERIIRTELGRVYNQSGYGRLVDLSKQFPFLRKSWRRTFDHRTRLGHVQAGDTYARGHGIPVESPFQVKVYNERPGKSPVYKGTATMRFPLDPATSPSNLSGAATILCRCNLIVDYDVADFAAYSAQQVSLALGGQQTKPKPAPLPAIPKPKPIPKPKALKQKKAKNPELTADYEPGGTKVSAAINLDAGLQTMLERIKRKVQEALNLLDDVHGDGNLKNIKAIRLGSGTQVSSSTRAYYAESILNGEPVELSWGDIALRQQFNSVFHEVGHFIDHAGFDQNYQSWASEDSPLFTTWREAVKNSDAVKTLRQWQLGQGAPTEVSRAQIEYMLQTKEVWARAYAQWVVVKSGNAAALRELREMQQTASYGSVDPYKGYNVREDYYGAASGRWNYPWVWSDASFQPIEAAIDAIMEAKGWRKRRP